MDAPFPHFARELRIRKKIAKRRTMGSRKRKIRGGDQRAQKQQFYERKETLQISLHFYGSRKRATVKYLFDSIPLPSRNYQTKRGSESFLCRAKGNQGRKRGKSVLTSEARRCTVSRVKTPRSTIKGRTGWSRTKRKEAVAGSCRDGGRGWAGRGGVAQRCGSWCGGGGGGECKATCERNCGAKSNFPRA